MSQLSTLPLMEGGQDRGHFPAFHLAKDPPPILFPFMIDNPVEHQGQSYGDQHLRHRVLGESIQQFNDHMTMGGSDVFPTPAPFRPTIQSIGASDMIKRSTYDTHDVENNRADGSASKWTSTTPPAKMTIVRKATNDPEGRAARKPRGRAQAYQADESQQQQQQQQQAMGAVRVCLDCNTTKTPLWRSGPCGPKSLCNACGIRQRKARRAMAVAVGKAASDAQVKPAKKEKRADVDQSLPFRKRCKMVDHAAATAASATTATAAAGVAAPKKDHDHVGEGVAMAASLSKAGPPPAFFHGFPRDEITDAAMLLMTLSYGLVRS